MPLRIAVLEDDTTQAKRLCTWLHEAKHIAHTYTHGEIFLNKSNHESFDLLIVDWQLPDINGIEVVQQLRQSLDWHMPIIFCTSRSQESDIVQGLEAGADDYMIKPLSQLELMARISAIMRRFDTNHIADSIAKFPPYAFNPMDYSVTIHSIPVVLTNKEFELALFLFNNAGRLLSRGHILERVWGQRGDLNTRTVDTHISTLRQKLTLNPQHQWRLHTIYRYGYRLEPISPLPHLL